jgi:hypothetical protein
MRTVLMLAVAILCVMSVPHFPQALLTDSEPLEAGEALHRPLSFSPTPSSNPVTVLFRAFIDLYQKKVSTNSVQRCPFTLSCSQYAMHALEHYDILGIPLFIDRFFFRENESLLDNYIIRKWDRKTTFDDSFYLHESIAR